MFTTADVGIATLRFGAEASGGDVDATASARLASTFSNSVVAFRSKCCLCVNGP